MITDPIADFLTRIRNAVSAKHRIVEVPASNVKKAITQILFEKGYILNYKFEEEGPQGTIKIALKYHPVTKQPAIMSIRHSRASCTAAFWRAEPRPACSRSVESPSVRIFVICANKSLSPLPVFAEM